MTLNDISFKLMQNFQLSFDSIFYLYYLWQKIMELTHLKNVHLGFLFSSI